MKAKMPLGKGNMTSATGIMTLVYRKIPLKKEKNNGTKKW